MATRKVQTGLRLEDSLFEKVKILSKMEHRSFNNFVEYILESYIEKYEAEHGPVQTEWERKG